MNNELGRCPTKSDNVYFLIMNKHHLQFLLPRLNYIIIDQRKVLAISREWCVKFKQTNQICSPLKVSQSINIE